MNLNAPPDLASQMCEKGVGLDAKIERYRQLSAWVSERIVLSAIKTLSDKLQAEKAALHPES